MSALSLSFGSRVRAVLGFSRVVQASLSVAQPLIAMLLALRGLPEGGTLTLALSAVYAGFLAVFALNDLMDAGLDRERFAHLRSYDGFDIDSAMMRHPIAQGRMTRAQGLAWVGGLSAYALVATYILNPWAALLFALAVALEVGYCLLARVTWLKFAVSGVMVGVGAVAGWAVVRVPADWTELTLLFAWMAAWEIGGRNIVNDFADVEEDTRLGIRTAPLVLGLRAAARLTFAFLLLAAMLPLALMALAGLHPAFGVLVAGAGLYLLLAPGWRLLRRPEPPLAMAVFNRASFYPPAALLALGLALWLG